MSRSGWHGPESPSFGVEHVVVTLLAAERIQVCEARVANVAAGLLHYLRGQLPQCQLQRCFQAFKVEGSPKDELMAHVACPGVGFPRHQNVCEGVYGRVAHGLAGETGKS